MKWLWLTDAEGATILKAIFSFPDCIGSLEAELCRGISRHPLPGTAREEADQAASCISAAMPRAHFGSVCAWIHLQSEKQTEVELSRYLFRLFSP